MPRLLVPARDWYPNTDGIIVGGNLLKNGNMEVIPDTFIANTTAGKRWIDGTAGGSTTNRKTNWATQSVSSGSYVKFDSSQAHSGSSSLRLSTTTPGGVATAISVGQYDTLSSIKEFAYPLHTGDYYSTFTLSWWMKTNVISGSAGPNGGACAGTLLWSGSGGIAGGSVTYPAVQTTTDWTHYTTNISFQNAGTRFVEVVLQVSGNSGATDLIMDAWFDDVVLKPTIPVVRAFI